MRWFILALLVAGCTQSGETRVEWDRSQSATGYKVYLDGKLVASLADSACGWRSCSLPFAIPRGKHRIGVTSVNSYGESAPTLIDVGRDIK